MNSPVTKFKQIGDPWRKGPGLPQEPIAPWGPKYPPRPGGQEPIPFDPPGSPGGWLGGPKPVSQIGSPFNPMPSFMGGQAGPEAPSQIPGVNSQGAGSPMPNAPTPQGPQQGPGMGNYGPFAQNARIPWLNRSPAGGTPNMWS